MTQLTADATVGGTQQTPGAAKNDPSPWILMSIPASIGLWTLAFYAARSVHLL
jgi:hypothetical protein